MLKCRFSTKGVWFKLDMNNFCSKCVCMIPMFLGIRCICAVHCIWLMGTRDPQSTWAEDHNKDGLCVSAWKVGNERAPPPGGCSSSARWNDAMIDALNFHSGDPRLVTRILKVALEPISESYKGLNANHAGGFQRCPPLFLSSIIHIFLFVYCYNSMTSLVVQYCQNFVSTADQVTRTFSEQLISCHKRQALWSGLLGRFGLQDLTCPPRNTWLHKLFCLISLNNLSAPDAFLFGMDWCFVRGWMPGHFRSGPDHGALPRCALHGGALHSIY